LLGRQPQDLPIEIRAGYNLKTANAIGLTIPAAFLVRVDDAID
jgi:hypothetical protein